MKSPAPSQRQDQKSAETRRLLMEACISLLIAHGYSRLTTTDIAARAGISRGALTYHFASKEELVTASLEHQLRLVITEMREFVSASADQANASDAVIDYLWDLMAGGLYYATLEYLPELRHNPSFKAKMIPVVREFHGALDEVWATLARPEGIDPDRAQVILNATMCLIRGMVGQTIVRDDAAYFRELLDFWKSNLRTLLHQPAVSKPGAGPKTIEGGRP
ncbi:TetR/AcrR family transcriptional regulator [Aureimonas glaciei]|uniref:TetR family transcriptional regulator n=1 Tax=Aureimonas glaciei TaxID=1776957 RepID=A0A917DFV3_9HYPH|nr:TetR/AcrR family transcriptional regulator [Aureimonas glaciei]GGD33719.1 TetR family transcriptional regulator [Aureimonas glaciei]